MLPSKYRLQKFSHLKTVKKIHGRDFEIVLKEGDSFKLGVIVTKKVAKKAVDRNRIKRIIHEAIKGNIENFTSPVIIILKNNIAHFKMQQLKEEFTNQFKKLK